MTNDTEKKQVWRMDWQGGEWSGKPSLMWWGAEVSHRIPGCEPFRQWEPGWCRAWTVRRPLWLSGASDGEWEAWGCGTPVLQGLSQAIVRTGNGRHWTPVIEFWAEPWRDLTFGRITMATLYGHESRGGETRSEAVGVTQVRTGWERLGSAYIKKVKPLIRFFS